MHERLELPRDIAVVDEEVLFDFEANVDLPVQPLEVAGALAPDAVPKDQVLGAGGSADRIRLHEPHPIEGAFERRRREEAARDGEAAKVFEGKGGGAHDGDLRCSVCAE